MTYPLITSFLELNIYEDITHTHGLRSFKISIYSSEELQENSSGCCIKLEHFGVGHQYSSSRSDFEVIRDLVVRK